MKLPLWCSTGSMRTAAQALCLHRLSVGLVATGSSPSRGPVGGGDAATTEWPSFSFIP